MNAATTFTDTVYLNAMGNANAVFVIKIYGALTTSTYSKVLLINGTLKETLDLTQASDAGGHLRTAGHALERISITAHNGFEPYKYKRLFRIQGNDRLQQWRNAFSYGSYD